MHLRSFAARSQFLHPRLRSEEEMLPKNIKACDDSATFSHDLHGIFPRASVHGGASRLSVGTGGNPR